MPKFGHSCHKQIICAFHLELPSLHVALAVSPGSDELLPSFSISFSSKSGIPTMTKRVYFEYQRRILSLLKIPNKVHNKFVSFITFCIDN